MGVRFKRASKGGGLLVESLAVPEKNSKKHKIRSNRCHKGKKKTPVGGVTTTI